MSAEKDKINKAYITLGKAYYDRHEGELEGKFADEFHTIQAGLVKIASLEDEIAELEGTRVCAECGAKVEKNAAFCSRCGAPMDSTTSADVHEPEEPEEMQETILEEKDEAATDEALDNAETEGTAGGHILVKVVKDVAAFGTARFDERLYRFQKILLFALPYHISGYYRYHIVRCWCRVGTISVACGQAMSAVQ